MGYLSFLSFHESWCWFVCEVFLLCCFKITLSVLPCGCNNVLSCPQVSEMAPVVQVWGDVFAMPTALAHCVGSDFRMSSGVAVGFKEYFHGVNHLLQQGKGVGQVAHLKHNSTHIFYLITKKKSTDKFSCINSLLSCLFNLRDLCLSLGVEELSMPRIGCGLDNLSWSAVFPRILAAFNDCRVRVNIVTPPPHYRGMALLGDSQGLRFMLSRGTLPKGMQRFPYPRSAGLCTSGDNLERLLANLDTIPDNGLGDVLVFIGTNDVLHLCGMEGGKVRETCPFQCECSVLTLYCV